MILDHEGFSMFYSGLAVFPLAQHRLLRIEGCQPPLGSFPLAWRRLLGLEGCQLPLGNCPLAWRLFLGLKICPLSLGLTLALGLESRQLSFGFCLLA